MNFTIYCNKKHSDNENTQCVSFDLRETVLLDVKQSSPPPPPPPSPIVYSTVYSGVDQRKHKSAASLAFVAGNSPGTGEFPALRASNAQNVSSWWRHQAILKMLGKSVDPLVHYVANRHESYLSRKNKKNNLVFRYSS